MDSIESHLRMMEPANRITEHKEPSPEEILSSALTKHEQFTFILKRLLPMIGTRDTDIVLAEVLLTLKLEGIIGHDLTQEDLKLIHIIRDSVLECPEKKEEALIIAKSLLA